jgi:hypothetical protein
MRILTALKFFVAGAIAHFSWLFLLNERGQGGAGGEVDNWRDTLPDDVKSDPIFEKYKEPAEAFRALVAAQKFLGREKLPVPTDENDKESYDLIFKKLGLPENETMYQFPTDLKLPKELPIDEAMMNDFRKIAYQHRLLPSQVSGLYKWYLQSMVDAYNKFGDQKKEFTKEAETNLRKKWGAAYPQNMALAQKVFQQFADDKTFVKFEEGYGNDPVMIELFANIGKVLSEDQLMGKPQGLTMTPDEAQIEINKIKSDMKHPYWNADHPLHADAVANMERLMKLTNPGE